MPIQFQPPFELRNPQDRKDRAAQNFQDAVAGAGTAIQAYQTHKLAMAQHDLQMQQVQAQIDSLKRESASKYGTGASAPQTNTPYSPPSLDQTLDPSALASQGAAGQPGEGLGPTIPSTPLPETPEQQISRIGTEPYGKLHPASSIMVPFINKEGQQIGQGPANTKIVDRPDTYFIDPNTKKVYSRDGSPATNVPVGADVKAFPSTVSAQNVPFKNEEDLRKEFVKESADQKANLSAANDALSAAQQNNAVGDTKLTYALVRGALGGSGRVTGAELGQWGDKVGGVSDKIMQGLQKAVNGQSFDPEIRSQIVDMVRQQAQEESRKLSATENTYRGLATDKGLQPGHVVVEQRPPSLLPYLNPNTPGTGKQLDAQTAMGFLKQANGDKQKARQMAKDQGYSL